MLKIRTCTALLCGLLACSVAGAADPAAQRSEYRTALNDLYAVRLQSFDARVEALGDYPLVPYLHYARLLRYMSQATPEDVIGFRTRWADTPLADMALIHWLDNLAERGRWATFREHYDAEVAGGTVYSCRYYRSLLETGAREAAFDGARELWVVDRSQPKVCDPLFDAWKAAGGITDADAWRRLSLALGAGRYSLGRYLVRFLDADSRALGELFVHLHSRPQDLRRRNSIGGDPERVSEVVTHALKRLARRDVPATEAALAEWQQRVTLDLGQRAEIREAMIRYGARQDVLPDDLAASWPPPDLLADQEASLLEELARMAVREQRWEEALAWLELLPDWAQRDATWQYWRARTQEELGLDSVEPDPDYLSLEAGGTVIGAEPSRPQIISPSGDGTAPAIRRSAPSDARTLYAGLARQRNYYGFMAADRTGVPFSLQREEVDLDETEIAAVRELASVQRARELHAIGEFPEARREMRYTMERLSDRELLALAEVARQMGWHRQAIQATIVAEHWDHIDLRFPLAFPETFMGQAERKQLQPSWLYAIARQESAFMIDARSRAGALGVMQVMPATARMTARRAAIPLQSTWQLLDYAKNIDIGSSYLQQMYQRYDNNRILASAAYNAGPGRVDRWMREHDPNPADVWIEAIPFRETRNYVQNVLAYSLIYSRRLGVEQPFLYPNER